MTVRDVLRGRIYEAEKQVARMLERAGGGAAGADGGVDFFGSHLTLPVERRFADVPSIQRYADAVLAADPVVGQWGRLPRVTVRERVGQAAAHYEAPSVIAVPVDTRWALRELVVCHELAHHIAHHRSGAVARAPHGPPFPSVYSRLTGLVMGPEVELLLSAALGDVAGASAATGARR